MKNGMICLFLHNDKTKVLTLVLIFWLFSFGCANAAISGTAYLKVHVDSKGNAQSVKLVRGIVKELDVQSIALCKSLTGLDESVRGKDIIVPVSYYGMCQEGAMTVTKDLWVAQNVHAMCLPNCVVAMTEH